MASFRQLQFGIPMEHYLGHLGGVLVILGHYQGILGFWYYNMQNVSFVCMLGRGHFGSVKESRDIGSTILYSILSIACTYTPYRKKVLCSSSLLCVRQFPLASPYLRGH